MDASLALAGSPRRSGPVTRRARRRTVALALLLGMFVLLHGFVYSHTVRFELLLNQRQRELKRIKEENALLRARVVQAQSAARIDRQVTRSLGMQLPERIEYVPVPKGVIDDAAQPAVPPGGPPPLAPQGY